MASDNMKTILILGAAGLGLWYLYEQGYLYSWTGITALYPGTLPAAAPAATSTPAATTPPAVTAPSTPAAATIQLTGPVKATTNNGLVGMVSINGAAPISIAVIPSQGTAWNSSGQGITSSLQAQGVNVSALISMMQAAYVPASSSASSSSSAAQATQCGGGLTAQDAAYTPYSDEITTDDIDCVSASLDQALASGQITTISGDSVLAYMLGWGGASNGEMKTTGGLTYKYNGTNWTLQTGGASGVGQFVSRRMIHGVGYARVQRGWLT